MNDLFTTMISEQGAVVGLLGIILFTVWKAYRKSDNRLFTFMEGNQKVVVDNTQAMTKLSAAVDSLVEAQNRRRESFQEK